MANSKKIDQQPTQRPPLPPPTYSNLSNDILLPDSFAAISRFTFSDSFTSILERDPDVVNPEAALERRNTRKQRSSLAKHSVKRSKPSGSVRPRPRPETMFSFVPGQDDTQLIVNAEEGIAETTNDDSENNEPNRVNNHPYGQDREVTHEDTAGLFSKVIFHWISPLMKLGSRRPLHSDDIWLTSNDRYVSELSAKVKACFEARKAKGDKNPLVGALHDCLIRDFWISGFFLLLSSILTVGAPYTLKYFIQFGTNSYISRLTGTPEPHLAEGIGFVVGLTAMLVLNSLFSNHAAYKGAVVGSLARSTLCALIFEKSLKISGRAKSSKIEQPTTDATDEKKKDTKSDGKTETSGWSDGQIFAMTSMDTVRIERVAGGLHSLWTGLIVIFATTALLIVNIGYSALPGFGLLLLSVPGLGAMVMSLLARRKAILKTAEKRVDLLHEVFNAIRFIKMFGWEAAFFDRVDALRRSEIISTQKLLALRNVVAIISISLPIFASMLSFITYAMTGHVLAAANAFSSVALFNVLRLPLASMPTVLYQAIDAASALKRIEKFLNEEEMEEKNSFEESEIDRNDSKAALVMEAASFAWEDVSESQSDATPRMEATADDSKLDPFRDPDDYLTVAGSDESLKDGRLEASQAFTLKQTDLAIVKGELVAVIGSVGSGKSSLLAAMAGEMIRLSGSVKWTQSKAYCAQSAWIQNGTVRENILFGEAMDKEWYRHTVMACSLARDLESLPNGDATIIGEKGVTLSGGQKQRVSLARAVYANREAVLMDDVLSAVDAHVGKHIFENAICGLLEGKTRILVTNKLGILPLCDRIIYIEDGAIKNVDTFENLMNYNTDFRHLFSREVSAENEAKQAEAELQRQNSKRDPKSLASLESDAIAQIEDEVGEAIPWSIYIQYFRSCGSLFHALYTTLLLVIGQGASTITILWLSWWIRNNFGLSLGMYVGIYAALSFGQALLLYVFSYAMTWVTTTSNKKIFDDALIRVLSVPVSFFDVTPLGRIVSRFSTEVDQMDDELIDSLRLFLLSLAAMIASYAIIMVYFHWFGVGLAVVLVAWFFLTRYFRKSARNIEDCESVLHSKVLGRFSEALSGAFTIRVYGSQQRFARSIHDSLDDKTSAHILSFAAQKWYAVRLDILGNALFAATGALVIRDRFTANPSSSGITLAFALGISGLMQFVVKNFSGLEKTMNSTARLYEYGTALNEEEPINVVRNLPYPPRSWPEQGAIEFSNVSVRYRPELPLVLKEFNMHINPGESVGFVGRTGAGKTSILSTLFRLNELASGSIKIDGQDISQLRLHDLRTRLAIVPQDPTLFRGTVRQNLDPWSTHTDLELWDALRKVGLASQHTRMPKQPEPAYLAMKRSMRSRFGSRRRRFQRTSKLMELELPQLHFQNFEEDWSRSTVSLWRNPSQEDAVSDADTIVASSSESVAQRPASSSKKPQRYIKLDDSVSEGGLNFSVGQRQLLALARAIVRDSRIVICDEVTSSVDMETDAAIQAMMREVFKGKTVLCIAHRLRTVLSYDKICVMDKGQLIEFGTPKELFFKGAGNFRTLCEESGITGADFE